MIIYIHGFGSSGFSGKVVQFREYFKEVGEDFIAPSLSYIPELAIQTLEELIESYNGNVKLIGSSLGGYYSIYLAQKYNLQAVLINPSIYPYKTLQRVIGDAPSYYDESSFQWLPLHVEILKKYETEVKEPSNFMLLTQKGDESLDYNEGVKKLAGSKMFIEDGGDHGFVGIERHFSNVSDFFML
ncbi:esterase [Sulfurimonas sp.]|nr:esterase [Sulfurimonas sp.]